MKTKTSNQQQIEAMARSVISYKSLKKNHRSKNTNTIKDLLTYPKAELKNLLDMIDKDQSLNDEVSGCCPHQMSAFIVNCHLINNRLVILVSNGAAATQLKYTKTEILTKLRQRGLWEITTITIKVSADS